MQKRNGQQYTPEERKTLVAQIKAAMKKGVTQQAACEDAGISTGSFFHWTGRRPSYAKKTQVLRNAVTHVDEEDVIAATRDEITVTILRGHRDIVADILRQMS